MEKYSKTPERSERGLETCSSGAPPVNPLRALPGGEFGEMMSALRSLRWNGAQSARDHGGWEGRVEVKGSEGDWIYWEVDGR